MGQAARPARRASQSAVEGLLLGLLVACTAPQQGPSRAEAGAGLGGDIDGGGGPARLPSGSRLDDLAVACRLPAPSTGPAWLRSGVGYQVWLRSFRDSDGDGHGDLGGLLTGLDALQDGKPGGTDLSVDVLWLSLLFPSPSDHGYDATDYDHVASGFGGDAALSALLKAAKARGLRVMLDLVLNHTSTEHPWFLDSASSSAGPRRSWYVWRDAKPEAAEGWGQPWQAKATVWHKAAHGHYYGLFWSGMPDLHYGEEAVQAEMAAVAKRWLAKGVDGFRLDAIRYLHEDGAGAGQHDTVGTHAFLRRLRDVAKAEPADAALVGEVWTDTATVASYLKGDELDAAFDFDTNAALRKGLELRSASFVRNALCKGAALPSYLQRFAGNHDMARLADLAPTVALQELAQGLVLLLPGLAWIYQGDELGLPSGDQPGDVHFRLPLPWTATGPGLGFSAVAPWPSPPPSYAGLAIASQDASPDSLRSRLRRWIALRLAEPTLRAGEVHLLALAGDDAHSLLPMVVRDQATGDELLVVAAFADGALPVPEAWRAGGVKLAGAGGGGEVVGPGLAVWRRGAP